MREPWQMSSAEYAAAHHTRIVSRPAVTFEAWCVAEGIDPSTLATPNELADELGTVFLGGMSGREVGKLRTLRKRASVRRDAESCYRREAPRADVERALDLTRADDAAWVRCQHKRAIRAAMLAGVEVPAEVLAEYPEIGESRRRVDRALAAAGPAAVAAADRALAEHEERYRLLGGRS